MIYLFTVSSLTHIKDGFIQTKTENKNKNKPFQCLQEKKKKLEVLSQQNQTDRNLTARNGLKQDKVLWFSQQIKALTQLLTRQRKYWDGQVPSLSSSRSSVTCFIDARGMSQHICPLPRLSFSALGLGCLVTERLWGTKPTPLKRSFPVLLGKYDP